MRTEQHGVQTNGNCPVLCIIGTDDDLGEDEVHPRTGEAHQRLIDDDRFRQRQDDLPEDLEVRASVQLG